MNKCLTQLIFNEEERPSMESYQIIVWHFNFLTKDLKFSNDEAVACIILLLYCIPIDYKRDGTQNC